MRSAGPGGSMRSRMLQSDGVRAFTRARRTDCMLKSENIAGLSKRRPTLPSPRLTSCTDKSAPTAEKE